MSNGGPIVHETLLREHVGPIQDALREETEDQLRSFYPLRYGPVLDQALKQAYLAGLKDGFVQGVLATNPDERA